MVELSNKFITKKEVIEKYSFLSANAIKNILAKDIGGFRAKVVRRLGRKVLFDEEALIQFISESKNPHFERNYKLKTSFNF